MTTNDAEKNPSKQGPAVLPLIGGILGLAGSFALAAKALEGTGDSPSGAGPLCFLSLAGALIGIAAGTIVKEALAFKTHSGSIMKLAWASIALVLLLGFWHLIWTGTEEGAARIRSLPAEYDLRMCRTSLEEYFSEHQRYPLSLEEAHCTLSTDVVMTGTMMSKDAYSVTAYHKNGNREYLIRSGSPSILWRTRGSAEAWVER